MGGPIAQQTMSNDRRRTGIVVGSVIGVVVVAGATAVPSVLLAFASPETRQTWSEVGEAVGGLGALFSGLAFVGLLGTLVLQNRQLVLQAGETRIALTNQKVGNEVALRQMHMQLISMAINDSELEEVWPPISEGVPETRQDHYCNLILYLQKVAFEAGTIEEAELHGVLRYLMSSPAMISFWTKSRTARLAIVEGDPEEDFFQAAVDRAYLAALQESVPGTLGDDRPH